MPDEINPPGPAPGPNVPPLGDAVISGDAVRPGGPGLPSDAVPLSRTPPPRKPVEKTVHDPNEPKDSFREIIETIVFVVVLVLMLKTFLAEAFVIPTGSMATTLLGYHKDVTCKQCGYEFRVNCSSEAEPQDNRNEIVESADCPNCFYRNAIRDFRGGRP